MSRLELFLRAVINVCTIAAIAFGMSVWIATPLFLAVAGAAAELSVRPYARNGIEKLLLSCGAAVTTLILVGLCLNLTPWGLTRGTWAVSWLVISAVVLFWRRTSGTVIRSDDIRFYIARHWLIGLYGLGALAIFLAAGYIAIAGVRSWNQRPILAFSLVSESATNIVVKIDAVSMTGAYRIVAQSGSRHSQRYSSPPILVSADGNGRALDESVPVNVPGRWTIYLNPVDGSSSSRELIVDVS